MGEDELMDMLSLMKAQEDAVILEAELIANKVHVTFDQPPVGTP